jgi:hypothetical protein
MITAVWVLTAIVILLTPLLFVLAVATDLVRRRSGWPTLRLATFVVAVFWIESTSELILLWTWVTFPFSRRTWTELNSHLMSWWARRLTRAAERIVGFTIQFDPAPDLGPGPLLAFCQHVSIVDAILPAYVLGSSWGWHLRYTLMRSLRFVPCMDIVAHRIPNHFVARGAADNTTELQHMRTLVTEMDVDEAGVIFPGGGLFTAPGLERAVAKLTERGSAQAEAAARFRHVMPPRPGGVNAFFDAAPDAHVVVLGTVGFEPIASIAKLWWALPVREPVEVRVWRYDRSEVPVEEGERLAWLYDKWAVMDDWTDERLRARAPEEVPA